MPTDFFLKLVLIRGRATFLAWKGSLVERLRHHPEGADDTPVLQLRSVA
jgi:hypothetical protein